MLILPVQQKIATILILQQNSLKFGIDFNQATQCYKFVGCTVVPFSTCGWRAWSAEGVALGGVEGVEAKALSEGVS